ncbi:hypothetical protein CTA1_8659 [Colletotrichum tanaceti]|uniref:C2H2-type domain-containing protein n=1 Tax=Colletotrichum tanaceti TaxID=1306861 RepID=A0A4U6XSD5_9PEZI|nr:hypothetical protein CTA1_8659 [Colletotrichum tanaceti]
MERPRGLFDMTDEQVLEYNVERQKRMKELASGNSKRYIARQRAQDLKGYLARCLKNRMAWQAKNKDKVLATAAGVRARAVASRRHECVICDMGLQSALALRKHLDSKAHLEQVRLAEGGAPKVVSATAASSRKFTAKHKAAKTYYCPVCDRAFNIKGHLDKHNASKKHLAKVAAADATPASA